MLKQQIEKQNNNIDKNLKSLRRKLLTAELSAGI